MFGWNQIYVFVAPVNECCKSNIYDEHWNQPIHTLEMEQQREYKSNQGDSNKSSLTMLGFSINREVTAAAWANTIAFEHALML